MVYACYGDLVPDVARAGMYQLLYSSECIIIGMLPFGPLFVTCNVIVSGV